jgi:glycosyltransferase involved in cell wall biosynthesis
VLQHYLPAEAFAPASRAGEGGYALVASRLSEEKGIDAAVRASTASGVRLVIAGEGPEEGALRELARSLGAPVEFVGRAARAEMEVLLAGAGALVMPSRYHEFAPYSAIEAMAAGVPVIASRLGGLPELIEPARCVPPGDSEALARRLRVLWDDPELRRSEGEALRARAAERHSEASYVERLLAIYAGAA